MRRQLTKQFHRCCGANWLVPEHFFLGSGSSSNSSSSNGRQSLCSSFPSSRERDLIVDSKTAFSRKLFPSWLTNQRFDESKVFFWGFTSSIQHEYPKTASVSLSFLTNDIGLLRQLPGWQNVSRWGGASVIFPNMESQGPGVPRKYGESTKWLVDVGCFHGKYHIWGNLSMIPSKLA